MPITAPGSAEERQATRLDKELLGSTWDGPIKKGSFPYWCLETLYIVLLRDHPLHHALAILPRAVRAALAAKGQPKPQAREATTRQCTKHKSMSSALKTGHLWGHLERGSLLEVFATMESSGNILDKFDSKEPHELKPLLPRNNDDVKELAVSWPSESGVHCHGQFKNELCPRAFFLQRGPARSFNWKSFL